MKGGGIFVGTCLTYGIASLVIVVRIGRWLGISPSARFLLVSVWLSLFDNSAIFKMQIWFTIS